MAAASPAALSTLADEVSVYLTPLYGKTKQRAVCYILEVDDCRLLLDCGWTDCLDTHVLHQLRAVAPTVDAVLLTHATSEHAGALPILISQLRSKCAVFSTQPVFRMGYLNARETVFGRSHDPSFTTFSLEDIDATFKVRTICFVFKLCGVSCGSSILYYYIHFARSTMMAALFRNCDTSKTRWLKASRSALC